MVDDGGVGNPVSVSSGLLAIFFFLRYGIKNDFDVIFKIYRYEINTVCNIFRFKFI